MKIKKRLFITTIIVVILIVMIFFTNIVNALTELQQKAADLNEDSKVDNQDMLKLVDIGYPERPVDGVPNTNYINGNAQEIIEKATSWMETIANDNTHGYNNSDAFYGQTGQYNCIGLNVMGWVNAGLNIDYKSFGGMQDLLDAYLQNNFIDITSQVNFKTQEGMQRGDVLIRLTKINGATHVEQYCGNGKLVGARSDNDGKEGDSGGHEIAVSDYTNYSFEYALRYVGSNLSIYGIIEKATSWMEETANDNIHGYNTDKDERYGQKGNYSCSGLNIRGWEEAGVPIRASAPDKYYQASNILEYYLAVGFVDVISQVNLRTGEGLQRGDVLLHSEGSAHVEQYCGNGKMVGARSDNDGKSGDSGGHEIEIINYQYNNSCYHFEHVLRYVGTGTPETVNAPTATKPTSATQLKLYNSFTANINPRALPCLTDNSTQKIQSFAITDIGTANEVIWYAYQKYGSNKSRTYITSWKNNERVYAATLEYGGEGQGIDIDKINGQYSIYTGSRAQGDSGIARGIYQYYANINKKYNNTYDTYNVKSQGTNVNSQAEISVDMSSGYAVVKYGGSKVKVYKVNNSTVWNTSSTFSKSNLVNEFTLNRPGSAAIQGGDLCGKYYYYLFGDSSTAHIVCYDVTTGKQVWSTSINVGSKVKQLVPGTTDMEPEGMKVYYYNGSYKVFIGYKVAGYKSAIFYFDC